MYTARFFYNIYEEKYAINPYYTTVSTDYWHLGEEYDGICFSVGYKTRNVMRYIKTKEKNTLFHQEDIEIIFDIKSKVNIKNEIVTITDIVKNLDGSIDYYINKKEYIPLNTKETFFDERPEKDRIPDGLVNYVSTEKEKKGFWNRLFNR